MKTLLKAIMYLIGANFMLWLVVWYIIFISVVWLYFIATEGYRAIDFQYSKPWGSNE